MAPRLKVFVTSDGLTDFVVAASSRAKALAAWGSRQDLFKTGHAHETDDAELARAALAEPEVVLRRPAGSRKTLDALKPKRVAKPAKPPPNKAALAKVARLEARLADLSRKHDAALAKLDAERAKRVKAYEVERATVQVALKAMRDALKG